MIAKVKKVKRKIGQYDLDGKLLREWDNITEIADELNISKGNLSTCLNWGIKTAKGFKWKYIE